jgi:adenosylcobinamide amidohydrolase
MDGTVNIINVYNFQLSQAFAFQDACLLLIASATAKAFRATTSGLANGKQIGHN